jgi:hypothetical protein
MARNGARLGTPATKNRTQLVGKKQTEERKRRDQELLEAATELAIELYGPALKELEKH